MSFSPSFFFFFLFLLSLIYIYIKPNKKTKQKPNRFWIYLSNKKELMPVFSKAQIIYKQNLLYPL